MPYQRHRILDGRRYELGSAESDGGLNLDGIRACLGWEANGHAGCCPYPKVHYLGKVVANGELGNTNRTEAPIWQHKEG